MVKGILAAVGTIAALVLAWFQWHTSPKRTLAREFKHDEKEREKFLDDLDCGDMADARKRWLRKVRENRLDRRD